MKFILKRVLNCSVLFVAIVAAGCSSPLNIRYVPIENPDNHLASISSLTIKLLPVVDKRDMTNETTLIGEKKTGVRVGKEAVKAAKPSLDIIREALESELTRSGHSIVNENEEITLKTELKHFWLKTDVNSADNINIDSWDIIAEIKIVLEINNHISGKSAIFGPYYAKTSERRFLMPANNSMERVFESALGKLLKAISSDTKLANALKK
jgi:uncharacterized lipoprotein YajG